MRIDKKIKILKKIHYINKFMKKMFKLSVFLVLFNFLNQLIIIFFLIFY
jgi:hypothetical protein